MSTWQRLDRRMLLVHPVTSVAEAWPALLGVVVAGSASGEAFLGLLALPVLLAIGVARYLTTTWRVAADRVEVRRGLLRRETLSTPVDRVRTVDLSAPLVHRALGLTRITLGTGVATSDDGLVLDALRREDADALRARLLARVGLAPAASPVGLPAVDGPDAPGHLADPAAWADGGAAAPPPPPLEVARFSPGWLRYAPFSGTALVATGALAAGAGQLANEADLSLPGVDVERLEHLSTALAIGVAALVAVVGLTTVAVLAVVSYLLTNHGFVLVRHHGAWHVTRGLLTQRETSIDVERLAGVALPEPPLLRLVGGGRVDAMVTGRSGDPVSGGLLPSAPRPLAAHTASAVLGTAGPVDGDLRTHGPAARTRRYTRAGLGAAVPAAGVVAGVVAGAPTLLLLALVPIALGVLALAGDRWRALGHAHVEGHVVMRSGSLTRRREMLAQRHVIGWTTRATWFQRRVGLVDLLATSAAGRGGAVRVPDVPAPDAVSLAVAATPGLLEPFLVGTAPAPLPHDPRTEDLP